tara:strand:- start:1384 stop:1548 length:165 start_codon:yes stop_codon:yes gene_type:complete
MTNKKPEPSSQENEGATSPDLIQSELKVEQLKKELVWISIKLKNIVDRIFWAGL